MNRAERENSSNGNGIRCPPVRDIRGQGLVICMKKQNPSPRHEDLLYDEMYKLEEQGYHIIYPGSYIPDAIVVSPEGKVLAVEVLGRIRRFDAKGKSKGYQWEGGKSIDKKRWLYQRYDDIIFILFDKNEGSDWKQRIVASEKWPHTFNQKVSFVRKEHVI